MPVLCQIDAWDPVAGAAVTLTAASHDDPGVCLLNGQTWWPALAKLPTLAYDLFDGAFGNAIETPSSSLTLRAEPWPNLGRYILADARLRLWTGKSGDAWANWTLRFDGRVTNQPTLKDGSAEVAFAVDDRWLDTSFLATYAGTTGVEGPAALKGTVKPLALGVPRYVAGVLIDSINSVFQVSAYGAVRSIDVALEKLARFGAPIGDFATYAALVAANVPAGAWVTCNAAGLARFGAPPAGQISFLVSGDNSGTDGWARTPGQLIRRLALLSGGAGRVNDASLNALDAARPFNLSLYLSEQTTAREAIQKLAASVNAVAGVSWTGQLFVAPVAIGAPTTTLAADGSALPPVGSVGQIEQAAPWQKLALTAERAWTVHQLADIAFTATLVDLGGYVAGTTYREGNIVELPSGARFMYSAVTPTAGNAPPNAQYWTQLPNASSTDFANVTGASKDALVAQAAAAASSATSSLAAIAIIQSDGYLSAGEKPAATQQWIAIANEKPDIDAKADSAGVDRSTYDGAFNALGNYLSSLTPAWYDASQDTAIVGSTFSGKFTDLYYARTTLLNAIAAKAATTAQWGAVGGDGKPADNATRNITTFAANAPANPADGDVWVDTSVNPSVVRLRSGGAWQASANLVTSTSQVTDGANLGGTATWPGVSGNGKPADNAGTSLSLFNPGGTGSAISGNGTVRTGSGWSTTSDEVYSAESYPTAVASGQFLNGGSEAFIGLCDDIGGAGGESFKKADFWWYRGGGHAYPATSDQSGNIAFLTDSGAVDYGANYAVAIDQNSVTWTRNGAVIATAPVPYRDRRPYRLIAAGNGSGAGAVHLQLRPGPIQPAPTTMPAIVAANLGYAFDAAPSYSASAGSPATATISLPAGSLHVGSNSAAYNAMAVGVSGTAGTTVIYQLYVLEPGPFGSWGGNKTLNATATGLTIYSNDQIAWLAQIPVTFPTSGSGSGSGYGGGGGGIRGSSGNPIP